MVIYKGFRFTLLGFNRWRVQTPNKAFTFDIILKGVPEIVQRVNLWREVIDINDYYRA